MQIAFVKVGVTFVKHPFGTFAWGMAEYLQPYQFALLEMSGIQNKWNTWHFIAMCST